MRQQLKVIAGKAKRSGRLQEVALFDEDGSPLDLNLTGSTKTTDDTPTIIDLGPIADGEVWAILGLLVVFSRVDVPDSVGYHINEDPVILSNLDDNPRAIVGSNWSTGGDQYEPPTVAAINDASVASGRLLLTVTGVDDQTWKYKVSGRITRLPIP